MSGGIGKEKAFLVFVWGSTSKLRGKAYSRGEARGNVDSKRFVNGVVISEGRSEGTRGKLALNFSNKISQNPSKIPTNHSSCVLNNKMFSLASELKNLGKKVFNLPMKESSSSDWKGCGITF